MFTLLKEVYSPGYELVATTWNMAFVEAPPGSFAVGTLKVEWGT
jgi:hypothetical protein